MPIKDRTKLAIAGLAGIAVVGGVVYWFMKKPKLAIAGLSRIKAKQITPASFDVTVTGNCTSSDSPIEYFDMSFYVNDVLGLGANWADDANRTEWTVGPPPSVNQELSYTFKWYPTETGTYTLKARLYVRNTNKKDVDVWSDPIEVTVSAGPPEAIVSISATAA